MKILIELCFSHSRKVVELEDIGTLLDSRKANGFLIHLPSGLGWQMLLNLVKQVCYGVIESQGHVRTE